MTDFRTRLDRLCNRVDTPAGRLFDACVQGLVLLAVALFSVSTLPGLEAGTRRMLGMAETLIIGIFTAEYLLRLWAAERRWRYVFSLYGVIDLVAIVPFYLAIFSVSIGNLAFVRVLRLLRIFQLLRLLRYCRAVQRFSGAFQMIRYDLLVFSMATGILLYLAAAGIWAFEHDVQPEGFASVFHCLWWAVITLTTVGYGDIYPVTVGGRVFTGVILLLGLGLIAVPAGLFASALSMGRAEAKSPTNQI